MKKVQLIWMALSVILTLFVADVLAQGFKAHGHTPAWHQQAPEREWE